MKVLLGFVKFFTLFQVDQCTAAENQCGNNAGQRLTGGRFVVAIGGVYFEHIILMRSIGAFVAAVECDGAIHLVGFAPEYVIAQFRFAARFG